MRTPLIAALACASALAACAYRPTPEDTIFIVDSPVDVTSCRRLGSVSDTVPTGPGFDVPLELMVRRTAELGGTDLYLDNVRRSDFSFVQGTAYLCPARPDYFGFRRAVRVVRAKG